MNVGRISDIKSNATRMQATPSSLGDGADTDVITQARRALPFCR